MKRCGTAISTILVGSVAFVLAGSGCSNSSPTENLDALLPQLAVLSPAPGDTVEFGLQKVLYSVSQGRGVRVYELVVNDEPVMRVEPTDPDKLPSIVWAIDSALIGTRARLALRAYDVDSITISSPVVYDLLITENTSPPAPPTNVRLYHLSPTSVNITWEDASVNELGFEVWRKKDTSFYALLKTLPPNAVSTNDTDLDPLSEYRYTIRALNAYGFAESEEVSTGRTVITISAPRNLAATPLGTRRVLLNWEEDSASELAFVIQRRVTSGSIYSQVGLVGPNVTTFIDTNGLSGGSSFTYRVAARGQFGQSEWSNEESVSTLFQDIYAPSGLQAFYLPSSGSVRLTWKDNSVLEIETRIERREGQAAGFVEIGKTGVDTTSFNDAQVLPGVIYTYRVRAYTPDGYYSDYSNDTDITVPLGSSAPGQNPPRATPRRAAEDLRDASVQRTGQ